MARTLKVVNLPKRLDFDRVWKLQKHLMKLALHNRQQKLSEDYLVLVEHNEVYTLGRGATPNNFKRPMKDIQIPIYHIERGGDVTWHGPGQLVAYPIIDLTEHKKDLHWFVRSMEESVIRTLKHFGVDGQRSDVNSGVWIDKNKISAVGITASRWITMHGTAINIDCDMKYFNEIIPCGISADKGGVCRLVDFDPNISLPAVREQYLQSIQSTFQFSNTSILGNEETEELLELAEKEVQEPLQQHR